MISARGFFPRAGRFWALDRELRNIESPAAVPYGRESEGSLKPGGLMNRILIATFFGVVAGAICASGAFYGHLLKFSVASLIWILLNRAVMGFVIGASGLKIHWAWNGIGMGVVVGSIFSHFLFMNLGSGIIPPVNALVNGLFGLMIEFFTTKVCKQPAFVPARKMESVLAA